MPYPISLDSHSVDFGSRFLTSTTVVASPAAASETIIAQLSITDDIYIAKGIWLEGFCSITIGTSGATLRLRLRQTNVSGAVVADTQALTVTAAQIYAPSINGIDAAAVLPNQTYVLTAQVGSGAATSTVASVLLGATIV